MTNTYKNKFDTQKHHAGQRGIDWQLTFEEWLAWWGSDIVNRGRKSAQLVMARIGDTGPYALSNIKKITVNDNHKEADSKLLGKLQSEETCRTKSAVMKASWARRKALAIQDEKESKLTIMDSN